MSYSTSGFPGNQPEPNQGWGNDPNRGWTGNDPHQTRVTGDQSGSQPSANHPGSQSSAGYADHQQGAYGQDAYAQQGAGAPGPYAPGPQQGYPRQPGAPAQQWGPRAPRTDQDSFVKAIFDFGFTRYATPSVVRILYILGIAVGVIGWFLSGLSWIMIGGAMATFNPYSAGGESTLFAVLAWIFGLIPLFFWVIALRVSLEFALAIVRISQDSKAIREKQA